ncbi:hypothetical protein GGQ85_003534 [Nitrobacter vulgaris]|nr:hypothetical protein [Nitrobacter vulgaris]
MRARSAGLAARRRVERGDVGVACSSLGRMWLNDNTNMKSCD